MLYENLSAKEMSDIELREAFNSVGFAVVKIKRWRDGQIDVQIPRNADLVAATEIGNYYGVIVCRAI